MAVTAGAIISGCNQTAPFVRVSTTERQTAPFAAKVTTCILPASPSAPWEQIVAITRRTSQVFVGVASVFAETCGLATRVRIARYRSMALTVSAARTTTLVIRIASKFAARMPIAVDTLLMYRVLRTERVFVHVEITGTVSSVRVAPCSMILVSTVAHVLPLSIRQHIPLAIVSVQTSGIARGMQVM